ncbi:MAG: T9SS type A sorting domain-containing protein [Bacteroidetes bacterium]|nr:T9SS type A sorting domain-containing protein [Bacteroidota bacterium]
MQKFLLTSVLLLTAMTGWSQSPTVVTNSTGCFPFRNFNTSDEGFSSPSIYSSSDDVTFNWDAAAGVEKETSGLTVRSASLISPVYAQGTEGSLIIGFRYEAPVGAEYRVRVISAVIGSPLEVLASTANGPVWTTLPSLSGTICLQLTDADLQAGRPIRYEFSFRLNQIGNIIFDDLSQGAINIALPVTFMGFVARRNPDESIKLLWNVAEETNVRNYTLEMSLDGTRFETAGSVLATGKSLYTLDYYGPKAATTYFRVKNTDIDGRSKYTPVIRVFSKVDSQTTIQLYPMPATDMVTVQHSQATSNGMITITGIDGTIYQQVNVAPFTLQTQLHINRLAAGIYIVKYFSDKQHVETAKLIKR